MKRKKEMIEWQRLQELSTPQTNSSEEGTRANPDQLEEGQQLWGRTEISRPQALMAAAINHLQGRQKDVYLLTMRDRKTSRAIAAQLGISQTAVLAYKERAIAFITAYCRNAGRITAADLTPKKGETI